MKQLKTVLIAILASALCIGAITTSTSDKRVTGLQNPVARIQTAQVDWVTSEGHAAQTADVYINGTIVRMDVVISTVTGNADLTVSITCTDENAADFGNELDHAALAHSATYYYDSASSADDDANFNPVTHNGTITVSMDPNEDTGGTAQTLAVDVIFYVR